MSTYEQPNALAFSLIGYQRQTFTDFEVVLCDDGSGETTRAVIEEFRRECTFPIKHVRQPNKGFRKAKIINQGVGVSEGRVLLFSDGDCIPHHDFVRHHAEGCGTGGFATGGHLEMTADYCRTLTRERVRQGEHEAQMTAAVRRHARIVHLKNLLGFLLGNTKKPKVYGRNFSVDRPVFYELNGFDENFDGFTKEDSDLRNRLRRHGARPRSLWGKAWVFHLHDSADPGCGEKRIPRGDAFPYYRRPDVPIRCVNGLVKRDDPAATRS